MSRLVLASSFMGKTYANNTYSNVYDFDQYTLRTQYKTNNGDLISVSDVFDVPIVAAEVRAKMLGVR